MLLDADEDQSAVGEDTWELFEVIEDSFGVELGSYYTLAGITVGQLATRIDQQTSYASPDRCLTSAEFHRIRNALITTRGISRKAVRPTTPLSTILPWRTRRADWQSLEKQLGLILPKLTMPGWLALVCLLLPATVLIAARVFLGAHLSWLEIVGGSISGIIPTLMVSTPFARSFPPECATLGELSKSLLARNYAAFASKFGSSRGVDIFSALRLLVATETGCKLEEVSTETRIPTDLGIY